MKRNGHGWMIRLAVLILVVLLVPVLAYNGYAAQGSDAVDPECYEHGDVNGDGVVDSRDAVQILYHSMPGAAADYPVNQDCDFNGDGKVDRMDALYILYGSFQLSQYPLDGQIHQFYAPEWKWDTEKQVSVTFKCGCGQTHSFTEENAVTITSEKTVQETCLSTGKVVYTAAVSFDGDDYTDTYEVVIPATGHQMTGTQSCTTASACANCDYTLAALGHDWQADAEASRPATCEDNAIEAFKCGVCGETKTNTLEGLERHDFVYVEDTTISGCIKAKLYRCSVCGEEQTSDEYATHTYVASIEQEATCALEGTKKYTCTDCGDFYTETILTNNSHTWDEGVTADGITTYTCASCSATKTAVVVTEGNTATVSKEALQDTEVQVNNAAIKLDQQTLEELGEEVQIDVAVVDTAEVVLDEELKAQIGENPVYDFSLSSGETQVSQFAGFITISLPYELQEGDDVDCIDVWFINDSGEVECVMGTYSNGQVTFTTDHFSYYTVTRLTPKQRCEHYGHLYNYSYKVPTCTANGHDIQICKRCGHVEKDEVLPMLEHKFIETTQAATCTEDGFTTKQCPVCKLVVSGVQPSLGHNWIKDEEQSRKPDCDAAGYDVFVCDSCGESYRNDLAQLEHIYESEITPPDCITHGHKKDQCILCGDTKEADTEAPTGHNYTADEDSWEWAEDYSSATVTLVCAHDENHTKTLTAVVGREMDDGKTCSDKITYQAVASFNKAEFTDTKVVDLGAVQHTPGSQMLYDEHSHYYQCQICGEKVAAAKHAWDEGTVLADPTCVDTGLMEYACTVCDAVHQQDIPATGKHVYVDGVCDICGLVENTCKHYPLSNVIIVDNAKWGICEDTVIEFAACDCGEYTRFIRREGCESVQVGTETIVTNLGEYSIDVFECIHCGLQHKTGYYESIDEENCITTMYSIYGMYMDGQLIHIDYNLDNGTGIPNEAQHIENQMRLIDLPVEGVCHNQLMETYCYCGESTNLYLAESDCLWENVPTDDQTIEKRVCTVCGLTLTSMFNSEQDGCIWNNSRTYTYELNGEEVYTFSEKWSLRNCDSEIVKIEYINGSCENGAIVYYECQDCGNSYADTYYGSHPHVYWEFFPVEGEGICWNELSRSSCACGQDVYIDFSTACSFFCEESSEDGTYDKFVCSNCGLTRTVTRSYGEKDENCNCYVTETHTYTDSSGNELQKLTATTYGEYHNIQAARQLVEGASSCVDGVVETYTCQDCGLVVSSYTFYSHNVYTVSSYDCADHGMCGDVMAIIECTCGQEDNWVEQETNCNWEYMYTPETGMYYQCSTCNTIRTYDRYMVSENGCEQLWNHDVVYIRDGEEVLRLSNPYTVHNHRSYYTFELLGDSCEDGFRLHEYCKDCDYHYDHGVQSNDYHGTWVVDRKFISQGKLCGDLEQLTTSCACGQEKHSVVEWRNGSCSYDNGEYYIDSLDAWVSKCSQCGIEQMRQETRQSGSTQCETLVTTTYTYRKNGVNMFTYVNRNPETNHQNVFTFEMFGETCDDGYSVTGVCARCGHTENWGSFSGCNTWLTKIETLDLGDQSCGDAEVYVYSCPCGSYFSIENSSACEWSWLDWTEETGTIYHCYNCGLYRYEHRLTEKQPDSCACVTTDSLRYMRDNEVVAEYTRSQDSYSHTYINTFELHGETCQDGYTRTEKCLYCGAINGIYEEREDHWSLPVEIIDLTQYGLCRGYISKNSCACGAKVEWNMNELCSWDCDVCGTHCSSGCETTRDPENCRSVTSYTYTFTRDSEEIYTFTGEGWVPQHEGVATFRLYNEEYGCDGGYEVTVTCQNCGYTYTASGDGHNLYEVEYKYFKDFNENFCDGAVAIRKCACGQNQDYTDNYSACLYTNTESEEFVDEQGFLHHRYVYRCTLCGLEKVEEWYDVINVDTCRSYQVQITTYQYNGEVLHELMIKTSESEHHTYTDVTYSLLPGAQNCEGGVLQTSRCKCGEASENIFYGHDTHVVETIDLTQYGLCNGTLSREICVCGERDCWNLYDCCWGCENCGMTFTQEDTYHISQTSCARITDSTYRITNTQGEELFNMTTQSTTEFHVEVATFRLYDESVGCDAGFEVTTTCRKCGYTNTWESDGHNHYAVDYLFLDAVEGNVCDGYIVKMTCPCGKYQHFDNFTTCSFSHTDHKEVTDSQGIRHSIDTYACDHCDLERDNDYYEVIDEANCMVTGYTKTSYRMGDATLIDAVCLNSYGDHHTYENAQYSLAPGATSCDQGLVETATCKYCGAVEETTHYYHVALPVETIDLQQYGAVCGTKFAKYACPCGHDVYGTLTGDHMCDMQRVHIDSWIEGAIDEVWQDTTSGSVYTDSDYWISTCAVTDPQCAFKIRAAEYYIQEGCEAVQYEIWQFGFNEETGEFADEIIFPTGSKHAYHSYVREDLYENVDASTTISGYKNTCSDCQSYCTYKTVYINDDHFSTEDIRVNTLDNGENKYHRNYYEYGFHCEGYDFSTLIQHNYTYADGREYWERYDYTYDLPDSCTRTCIYTDSDGGHHVNTEECHMESYEQVVVKEATCTQFGQRINGWHCVFCGNVTSEYTENIEPTDHNWLPDIGYSVCGTCGLQNVNGASGSIVMEDMTDSHGNGTDYVVGYWNRTDVSVHKYVSVVLNDATEGAEDELILDGIAFTELSADTDGITAVTFNQADAVAAALAAMEEAGYTGNYAIRFTFVPTDAEDTLDYAITFDALSV